MANPRGFREVEVERLSIQTAYQRFNVTPSSRARESNFYQTARHLNLEEDLETTEVWPKSFVVSEFKLNLTALSHVHNLYFVAYADKVHVFRVSQQTCTSSLKFVIPRHRSPQTMKKRISKRRAPVESCVNHLVVGNLGEKEILLLAHEDGDVVAMYTDDIENAMQEPDERGKLRSLFCEYVNDSAWGLAIHSQSRMIAVGSNAREVSIFSFALSSQHRSSSEDDFMQYSTTNTYGNLRDKILPCDRLFELVSSRGSMAIPRDASGKVLRNRNMKVVKAFGKLGCNIPSLSFSSDRDGQAESLVVKDIRGALWFLHLWTTEMKRISTVPGSHVSNFRPDGWGVLVLPENFFKPTITPCETYGKPLNDLVGPPNLLKRNRMDLSKPESGTDESMSQIESAECSNLAIPSDMLIEMNEWPLEIPQIISKKYAGNPQNHTLLVPPKGEFVSSCCRKGRNGKWLQGGPETMTFRAHHNSRSLSIARAPHEMQFERGTEPEVDAMTDTYRRRFFNARYNDIDSIMAEGSITTCHSIDHLVTDGSIIVHTNLHDLFLRPSTNILHSTHDDWCPKAPETAATAILQQRVSHGRPFRHSIDVYNRLSMLTAIPELSLLIVGSQVGRVALCTITRPRMPLLSATPLSEVPESSTNLLSTNGGNTTRLRTLRSADKVKETAEHFTIVQQLAPTPTFRIDSILPTKKEETQEIRPSCGLLGIAIAPMWRGTGKAPDRSRWKLMLHYYNSTIVSYELSRGNDDEIVVDPAGVGADEEVDEESSSRMVDGRRTAHEHNNTDTEEDDDDDDDEDLDDGDFFA